MYFFKKKNRQIVDFKGDLIITHNEELISAFPKSAAPFKIVNAKNISLYGYGFINKIKATYIIINFVWFKNDRP